MTSVWRFVCRFGLGEQFQVAGVTKPVLLSQTEQEQIRWYLEDYPELAANLSLQADAPERAIANAAERLIQTAGEGVYRAIVEQPEASRVLPLLDLSQAAISVFGDPTIPWEMMRRPNGEPLSVLARRFARTIGTSIPERPISGPLNILWIISRPKGEDDLPFRTVAKPVVGARHRSGN